MENEAAVLAGFSEIHAQPANPADAERDLVERAASDPEAFGRLYEANYSLILNYIFRRTLDATLAEELTSNTFFHALRALSRYRHNAPFRYWLYRIATNEIRMYFRSRARRAACLANPAWAAQAARVSFDPSPAEDEMDREMRMRLAAKVRRGMARLPERYAAALSLRYFEAMSYEEISKVLGKKETTIRSLVHRGLKKMMRLLDSGDATHPGGGH